MNQTYDEPIEKIADYVSGCLPEDEEALSTARLCLMDSLGCGILALQYGGTLLITWVHYSPYATIVLN